MSVQLNHTIVFSHDKAESARFMTEILGLPPAIPMWRFLVVNVGNGLSLDFATAEKPFSPQHYAFLITEIEFDQIFGRIKERRLQFWADPACSKAGEINHNDGGRGVYFRDPSDHLLEVITRPYGG